MPHQRLLKKLSSHGIEGNVKRWIGAWLTDRYQRVCIKGVKSSWLRVLSGVPQGSVLGPVLFLIYINDLDEGILSWILKFADDTKAFRGLPGIGDSDILQADIDRLFDWSVTWQMMFNVQKCKVMHFGRGNPCNDYKMNNIPLEKVKVERDLGVLISDDLKVSSQCAQAYAKANRMLGLVKRAIINKEPEIMVRLYKTLVRPHVEYCTAVWSPHYQKDKELIEKIQHRFTKMIPKVKHLSYEDRIRVLRLWTLEERRNRADLIQVFKMYRGLAEPKFEDFFELDVRSRTRGHPAKIVKHRCETLIRQKFFSERVVNSWNRLDTETVLASSVDQFKGRLAKLKEIKKDLFRD